MTDRSIAVRLVAITSAYQAAMAKATASTRALGATVVSTGRSGSVARGALEGMGMAGKLALGGTALAAYGLIKGLASSTRAALDFETSFAGIRKTMDGSDEDCALLAQGMRNLAQEIPVSVNELNKIGELGGQMGIPKEALIDFTRTIAMLGETTDLSTEEAAMSLAQFAAITRMSLSDIDNLGATIVDLGNHSAATEQMIIDFGRRIAGAGEIAGLSEAEILSIGTALASLGVEAEAGGTAVQKVLLFMTEAAETGSEKLAGFADASGMSAEAFTQMWSKNPAEAFTRFVEGLGTAGKGAITILNDLGLTDARLRRSFLSLATAGGSLRDNLELGNKAMRDGTALQQEFAKRMDTTESKMALANNQINDFKITLGQELTPILGEAAQALTDFALAGDRAQESTDASVRVITQLADSFSRGTIDGDRFIKTVMGNLAGLDQAGTPETVAELRDQLEGLLETFRKTGDVDVGGIGIGPEAWTAQAESILKVLDAVVAGEPILAKGTNAFDSYGSVTGDVAEAVGALDEELSQTEDTAKGLTDAFNALFGIHIDAERAAMEYRGAIRDMADALDESNGSLDKHTEKGDAARSSILDAVEAARDHASALVEEGTSIDVAAKKLRRRIEDIQDEAVAAGTSREAVEGYINQLELTPAEIKTFLRLFADKAKTDVDDIKESLRYIDGFQATATVNVRRHGDSGGSTPLIHSGGVAGATTARRVSGSLRSDEVPAILQRGEIVLSRAQARSAGDGSLGNIKPLIDRLETIERRMRGPARLDLRVGSQTFSKEISRQDRRRKILLGTD